VSFSGSWPLVRDIRHPPQLRRKASDFLAQASTTMTFNFFLRDSGLWTAVFFALVIIAVFTQLTKTTYSKSLPVLLRALIKAAPALFLSGLCWYLNESLVSLGFLLCGVGDILLDLPEQKAPRAFYFGALSFAAALICFDIVCRREAAPGYPLLPLFLTNLVIAIFVLRWVIPTLKGIPLIAEVSYFGILIISNAIASTTSVPIFLGSSLWLMSDLSIGLSSHVSDTPANSLDTLGLYDVGLYFFAIGFLNF
jgi:uncharacterized membrane protein YhhN